MVARTPTKNDKQLNQEQIEEIKEAFNLFECAPPRAPMPRCPCSARAPRADLRSARLPLQC